ncbi:MAG: DUF1722 domain-containing protein [Pseudomonadales bacterium]|nr:DUF1722 domain-containing protein [Pseudomonadales bacterium]MDG1444023.1 DUF1722 domain-containing protein [Pseudomonadales bacterium]
MLKLGVGACIVGSPVRYSGDAKRHNPFMDSVASVAELVAFCPEVSIGLGVPREPIRLVDEEGQVRVKDSSTQTKDFTNKLQKAAQSFLQRNTDLSGYILVKGSPSCGTERVKVYNENGNVSHHKGQGGFVAELLRIEPLLPVEEDGRLNDARIRENFFVRAYVYRDWKELQHDEMTAHRLITFYSQYKYLVMAHDIPAYKEIGRLLAEAGKVDIAVLSAQFINLLMLSLKNPAKRSGLTNTMQHIRGYLKRTISSIEKVDVDRCIDDYRTGLVPLVVPMKMLQHLFNVHPNPYIRSQVFMSPYPEELRLRNNI